MHSDWCAITVYFLFISVLYFLFFYFFLILKSLILTCVPKHEPPSHLPPHYISLGQKNFFLLYFTLQYCIGFPIHQHESATGVHVFPILNPLPPPSPYHLSGSSQCTGPRHPVSCIKPRLVILKSNLRPTDTVKVFLNNTVICVISFLKLLT